jgi:uncharacterized protein (DUF362 family)/NAD-dependent dihydropyrimidine dehydrogenase PreA subunit
LKRKRDHKVYVVRCRDYRDTGKGLDRLLAMMGGDGEFVQPGERIALKANILRKAAPEEAVTTHPSVIRAAAEVVQRAGGKPVIADSPGGGYRYTPKMLEAIYERNGILQVATQTGAALNYDTAFEEIPFPDGRLVKRFEVITPIRQSDGVFNLCKLKAHSFTYLTGAIKNNFGVIPGLRKPGYHARFRDTLQFTGMLLDLAELISPRLSIMDAVVAMEGQGPSNGTPKGVGLLLAARDPLALDVVAGEIMGLPRNSNPFLIEAENRGTKPHHIDQVELIGVQPSELRVPGFELPTTMHGGIGLEDHLNWWQRLVAPYFKSGLSLRPQVIGRRCTACGACRQGCPMGAIRIIDNRKDSRAFINNDLCIRCYCCHEMCAADAIRLKGSLLYRLIQP